MSRLRIFLDRTHELRPTFREDLRLRAIPCDSAGDRNNPVPKGRETPPPHRLEDFCRCDLSLSVAVTLPECRANPMSFAHKPQNGCSWPSSIRQSLMSWRTGKRQKKQSDGCSARISIPWTDYSRVLLSQWNRHYKKEPAKRLLRLANYSDTIAVQRAHFGGCFPCRQGAGATCET